MKPVNFKKFISACSNVAFPKVCACCGLSTFHSGSYLCNWCVTDRFEKPNDTTNIILPQNIADVYSMWAFDKGGYLQDLLHKLKYNYLRDVGIELGNVLGRAVQNKGFIRPVNGCNPLLIPVPLHSLKKRKRGYNQARALANGVAEITGWHVLPEGIVKRVKNTSTQTGLNTEQRSKNLKGAFQMTDTSYIAGKIPVVIDDVFTTGATTFELANALQIKDNRKAFIITVASA